MHWLTNINMSGDTAIFFGLWEAKEPGICQAIKPDALVENVIFLERNDGESISKALLAAAPVVKVRLLATKRSL